MARIVPLLTVPALVYAAYLIVRRVQGHSIDPVSYFVLNGFYHWIWPITLSILLAARNPIFLIAVALSVALVQHQILASIKAKAREKRGLERLPLRF
jgi:hypothetical protein